MITRIILVAALFFGLLAPAEAQFAGQSTAILAAAGTNTITGTLANVLAYVDVLNAYVTLTPANGNTGATTLNLNSIGAIAINKPTAAGLVALTGTELVANQPAILMYNGTVFVLLSVTSTTVGSANFANSALSAMGLPTNMQLNGSATSNQLTIALCAINAGSNTCNNPSATSPLLISFRDATAANGDPAIVSLQAALNFTAASTSSFGCVTATVCRLWVVAINNAGTVALCAFNALSGTSVAPINEAANQTSQSGTSGGTSAQLYYCSTSAVTGKAIRILGYVEATWVSGTGWSTTPAIVQIFGPGIKKPGDVVQTISSAPITTLTTLLTAQTQTAVTASITPTSATNIIRVRANVSLTVGSGDQAAIRLSRGTGPTLFGPNTYLNSSGGNTATAVPVTGTDVPSTTSSTTYYVYGQATPSGGGVINDNVSTAYNPSSEIIIEEIMSSLEPANDNAPLRMVG